MTLGIIAGRGDLPLLVADACSAKGQNVVIAKILDSASGDYGRFNTIVFKIGEVGRLFAYFRAHNVSKVIMAGGLSRPKFTNLKVDSVGATLLTRIVKSKFLGDDKVLRIVASFIEEHGFKVVSATSWLQDCTFSRGIITVRKPSERDLKSIERGAVEAKKLGMKDLGQAVVVKDSAILGVEGPDGTDALMEKCGAQSSAAILVKVVKPTQDERFDMPTIGVNTIHTAASFGFAGIAIDSEKVIVIDREEVVRVANELGIFIIAI
jgi:DUF1009 family protein